MLVRLLELNLAAWLSPNCVGLSKLVELVGRYSNPDEWEHLADTTQALAEPAADAEALDELRANPSSSSRRPWPVTDRLGEQTVRELLRDRRSGVVQRVLAVRYGISSSSVKRILRRERGWG
jgi:hypothetical protein